MSLMPVTVKLGDTPCRTSPNGVSTIWWPAAGRRTVPRCGRPV